MAPVFAHAQAVNGSDDVSVTPTAPATDTTPAPATNGSDDVVSAPASNTSGGGSVATPTTNGSDDTNQPSTPSTPNNPGGGNGSGGGSSSTGSSGSSVLLSSTATSTTVTGLNLASTTCNYLNDYLKIDRNNNIAEVTKLQAFLKNTEKLDVDINGKFDTKTFEAVKAFQTKYLSEVLGPWGANIPSGQVWYTTKKKVNEIYCKSIVNLTPAQLAEIEAYRNKLITTATENLNSTSTPATTTPDIGSNTNGSQTAAAGNVPFTTKVWNFIKWLFGY